VSRGPGADLAVAFHELDGRPAIVLRREGAVFAALLLGVADGTIAQVYFCADQRRLGFLGQGAPKIVGHIGAGRGHYRVV
jgi:hypothetical protein